MASRDAMQKIASNSTSELYFDYSDTQAFYLYDIASKSLPTVTSAVAKNFFTSLATWTASGLTFWGYQLPSYAGQQRFAPNIFTLDKSKLGGSDVLGD